MRAPFEASRFGAGSGLRRGSFRSTDRIVAWEVAISAADPTQ
jgi:hypothetical protein